MTVFIGKMNEGHQEAESRRHVPIHLLVTLSEFQPSHIAHDVLPLAINAVLSFYYTAGSPDASHGIFQTAASALCQGCQDMVIS